jgi:hypothetical protein
MDESKFWACIELIYQVPEVLRMKYDFETLQRHLIKKHLKQHELKDLVGFQKILAEKVLNLFQPKIADIFYMTGPNVKGRDPNFRYIPNDGFLEFRLWVVCLGRHGYETFLNFKNEEQLLKYNLDCENTYVSGFDYFVDEIYEEMNPEDDKSALDYCHENGVARGFDGDYKVLFNRMNWNTLEAVYPKLFKTYQSH